MASATLWAWLPGRLSRPIRGMVPAASGVPVLCLAAFAGADGKGGRRYRPIPLRDPSRTWREDHHCSATIARTLRASSSDIVVSCFGQSLTETWENTCSTTLLPTRGLILLTRRPSTQSPGRKCHHRVVANDDHLSGQSRTGKASAGASCRGQCRCVLRSEMDRIQLHHLRIWRADF